MTYVHLCTIREKNKARLTNRREKRKKNDNDVRTYVRAKRIKKEKKRKNYKQSLSQEIVTTK